MFCERCGKENENTSKFCVSCGAPLTKEKTITVEEKNTQQKNTQSVKNEDWGTNAIILGLIAFFIGTLGIHNFIMGYTKKGVAQVLLSTIGSIIIIGPVISGVWAFIEAIMLFAGTINCDARGNLLHR